MNHVQVQTVQTAGELVWVQRIHYNAQNTANRQQAVRNKLWDAYSKHPNSANKTQIMLHIKYVLNRKCRIWKKAYFGKSKRNMQLTWSNQIRNIVSFRLTVEY